MKRSSTKHSSGFYEDMKQTSNATSSNGESSTSDDSFKEHNGSSSSRPRYSPPPLIPTHRGESEGEIITIDDDTDDEELDNSQPHEDEENDVSLDSNDYQNNNESSSPDRHLAPARGDSNGSGGNRDSAGSSVVFVEDAANLELEQLSKVNTAVVLDPSEKVAAANFKLLKLLGTGAYGRVYLVQKIDGVDKGEFYAMKILEKEKVTKKNKTTEHTRTEREVLERIIDCPFLATLNYAFQTPEKLYLVLDFVQGGELFSHLYKTEFFQESQVRFYIAEIIVALEQLHSINIIYRDIKLENILIDDRGHIVITDFGLSKELKDGARAHSYCGTIEYMAPEIVSQNKEGHDLNVDWWSVGVLVIELLTGQSPFSREGEESNQGRISERIRNQPPTIPSSIGKDAKDLILKLLEKDPSKRLGFRKDAAELKKHKFFKSIDWKKLKEKALTAPMVPTLDGKDDVRQFSEDFTREEPRDEPGVPLTHANAANLFRGYSFIAPHLRRSRPAAELEPEALTRPSLHSVLKAQKLANSKFFAKYEIDEEDEPIGDGTYSICMRCTSKETGVKYAVKIMNKLHDPSKELEALRQCGDHPNIVKFIEDVEDSNFKYIVFELLSGGELFSRIREHNHFSEDTARVFFKQLVDAVKFMHDRGIVHRDLKPENIMFISEDEQSQLKIVDFGFARKHSSEETSPCFTLDYAAPESLSKGTTKDSRDMWSLGVILYTMLVGHTPFMPQHINKQTDEMKYRKQLTENISKGLYNQKSENFRNISDNARSLISCLLEVDEEDRCNFEDLYQHPWLVDPVSQITIEPIDHDIKNVVNLEPITIDDDSTDDSSGIVLSERNEGSSTSSHAEAELNSHVEAESIVNKNTKHVCKDEPQVQLPAAEIAGVVEQLKADDVPEIEIMVEGEARHESELQEDAALAEVITAITEVTKQIKEETKMPKKKLLTEVEKEEIELPEPLLEMPLLVPFEFLNGRADETELPFVMPTLVESRSEDFPGFVACEKFDIGMWKEFFYQKVAGKVPISIFKPDSFAPKKPRGLRGRPPKGKRSTQLVMNPVNQVHSKLLTRRSEAMLAVRPIDNATATSQANSSLAMPAKPKGRPPGKLTMVKIRPAMAPIESRPEVPSGLVKSEIFVSGAKTKKQTFEPEAPPQKKRKGRPPKVKDIESPVSQLVINPVHSAVRVIRRRKPRTPELVKLLAGQHWIDKPEPSDLNVITIESGPRYPGRKRVREPETPLELELLEEPVKKKRKGRPPGKRPIDVEPKLEIVEPKPVIIKALVTKPEKPSSKPRGRPLKNQKPEPVSPKAIQIISNEVIVPSQVFVTPKPPVLKIKTEPIRKMKSEPVRKIKSEKIRVPGKPGRPKKEPPRRGRPRKNALTPTVRKVRVRKQKRRFVRSVPEVIILERNSYPKSPSKAIGLTFLPYRAMMAEKLL